MDDVVIVLVLNNMLWWHNRYDIGLAIWRFPFWSLAVLQSFSDPGKLFTEMLPFTKQYKLVPINYGEKVTTAWQKVVAACYW